MSRLTGIVTASGAQRDCSLDAVCQGAGIEALLEECRALDSFRRSSDNLYERVRALFFLYAIHRFHIPRLSASAAPADAPIRPIEPGPGDTAAATPGEAAATAKFASDAKWEIAGYNNEEIVYSILVTNQDTRILHCSAELHGFYFENGEKRSISDRQSTTVFPGKQVNVGHWMGMDQKSGATYKVSCRAQ